MLTTKRKLVNAEKITSILMAIIHETYEEVKEEEVLLCLDCLDVDLRLATHNNDDFFEAVKENFELDEENEVIDYDGYKELMEDLNEEFILLHSSSGLFDYFPDGEYTVGGEERLSESEYLAPKGVFYAPFEDAVNK